MVFLPVAGTWEHPKVRRNMKPREGFVKARLFRKIGIAREV
jgi:hypothetical protein